MAESMRHHQACQHLKPFLTRKGGLNPAGEDTCLHYLDQLVTVYARAQDTGGAYGLLTGDIPQNSGPPPHVHTREDEGFLVMSGRLHVWVGDEFYDVTAGSFVFLPKGVIHWFKAVSPEPTTVVCIVAPGGQEKMFRMVGKPTKETVLPGPLAEFPIEKLMEAGKATGLTFYPEHNGWAHAQEAEAKEPKDG